MKKPALKTALMVALLVTLVATGICVAAYHALPQTQTRSQHLFWTLEELMRASNHRTSRFSTLRVICSTYLSPPARPWDQSVVPTVTTVPPRV
jgi:hypothetical protein